MTTKYNPTKENKNQKPLPRSDISVSNGGPRVRFAWNRLQRLIKEEDGRNTYSNCSDTSVNEDNSLRNHIR
jgi:hypothetical protein